MFSYIAKKNGTELEADLTCLYQSSYWSDSRTEVVHAECKSFNRFESRDVSRMASLSVEFPGSVLVFATLSASISASECEMISQLSATERTKRLNDEQYSPIIILTGVELFSTRGVGDCWNGRKGIYEELCNVSSDYADLKVLSDATQQIYLGFPAWHEWHAAQPA